MALLLAGFQSEMRLISRGSYLHSFNTAFLFFLQGCNFCSQVQVRVCLTVFGFSLLKLDYHALSLSVPMTILGVCAQWHSKFSNILVVCADRRTRIGFRSVRNYTGRPAFRFSFFHQKKKKSSTEVFYTFSIVQPHGAQVCTISPHDEAQTFSGRQKEEAVSERRGAYRKGQSLLMQRFSCATTDSESDMKRLL